MSILNYFPQGYTPTPLQQYVLLELERLWNDNDVLVIDGAVALGKSFLAMTLLNWNGSGVYAVPNRVLLGQLEDDFPNLPTLRARDSYLCNRGEGGWTCAKQEKKHGNCPGCPKVAAEIKINTSRYAASTLMGVYSNRMYKDLQLVDEAHTAVGWLRGLQTKSIPKSTYHWPDPATPETMKVWIKSEKKRRKDAGKLPSKAITALESNLNGRTKSSIAYRVREPVQGHMDDVIKVSPAICSGTPLWPGHKVSKVVLMSATLSDLDILQLGLNNKRVTRIVAGSPIPPQNRPVVFTNEVQVTWENREAAAWELAQAILKISYNHPNEAGIVHIPYSLAESVGQHLKHNPRFIFHKRENKVEKLNLFLTSGNGVFLASGFAEGLSLGYDKARFNVIAKASFPNKTDPFVVQMSEKFPQWASEQAAKTLLQAYGRTTRRENDYSMTYILDTMAWELYKKSHHMFPQWFKMAVLNGR